MHCVFLLLVLVASCLGRVPYPSQEVQAKFRMNQQPYIIGGEDADTDEYPFQAYMLNNRLFYCGASIISDEWVLTAAHCIFFSSPDSVLVGIGYTNRDGSDGGQEYNVDEVNAHPDFTFDCSEGYDVGVMHLVDKLTFTDAVQPVALANLDDDFAGESGCYITGWGLTDGSGFGLPQHLQEAEIDVYTLEECEDMYSPEEIDDNAHICVGVTNEKGSCDGDSGGPAICPRGGDWVQFGVTSWGLLGCSTSKPSVYTDVGFYRSWINDNCDNCLGDN